MVFNLVMSILLVCFLIADMVLIAIRISLRLRCNRETKAIIVDKVELSVNDFEAPLYFPEIRYTVNNEVYNKIAKVGYSNDLFSRKFILGQEIDILYNESDPDDYCIKDGKVLNILIVSFSVAVIILFTVWALTL